MVMTKSGAQCDPRPNAGGGDGYSAPSPRVAKNRQQVHEAPSSEALPSGGPAHAAFEAMSRPIKQPGKR
jgi:hypothetical protein